MKPLADQLACARRELALRRSCYPKWVQQGRMTQQKADDEIACMEGIVYTVERAKLLEEVTEKMKPFLPPPAPAASVSTASPVSRGTTPTTGGGAL